VKKIIASGLLATTLLISLQTKGQSKKFLEQLKNDTTNNKISIDLEGDKQKRDSIKTLLEGQLNYKIISTKQN
jgi:hypothetical protein